MAAELFVQVADITTLAVDAIVNAANRTLAGGGGVDGAIHRAAGPALKSFLAPLAPVDPGDAVISPGFDLPARHIIHAVGPIYGQHGGQEPVLLASCYARALALARANKVRTLAFAAISTGVYGYPKTEAAPIAVQTVRAEVASPVQTVERVIFCCFDEAAAAPFRALGLTDPPPPPPPLLLGAG